MGELTNHGVEVRLRSVWTIFYQFCHGTAFSSGRLQSHLLLLHCCQNLGDMFVVVSVRMV